MDPEVKTEHSIKDLRKAVEKAIIAKVCFETLFAIVKIYYLTGSFKKGGSN